MDNNRLEELGIRLTPIGYGAFKLGRNEKIKYPRTYALPTDKEAADLLGFVLDVGINYIDTAPAYGLSEQRIGTSLRSRRDQFFLSTKVGEAFERGRSGFDFSRSGIERSIANSRRLLHTDLIDIVYLHSGGDDLDMLDRTDAVTTLLDLKARGEVRCIGLSATSAEGAIAAAAWADVVMVEYNHGRMEYSSVIRDVRQRGAAVVVKKGLDSGWQEPCYAIPFALEHPDVACLLIGSLSKQHIAMDVEIASSVVGRSLGFSSDHARRCERPKRGEQDSLGAAMPSRKLDSHARSDTENWTAYGRSTRRHPRQA